MAVESAGSHDYDALYREFSPRVRALARRQLPNRNVSEDVVQDVFLRAFRAIDSLDPDRPVWPWLRRITLNVCTDVLRAPRTWVEESVAAPPEDRMRRPSPDPVDSVLAAEHRRLIVDALATLAPRQREALLRRVVDGASTEALAANDSSSIDAMKSAVKRGRHVFRKAYMDLGQERGLLGASPSAPSRFRAVVERARELGASAARLCNSEPALQALPAAVSVAVLLLGFGGHHGAHSNSQAAAAGPPAGARLVLVRAGAVLAAAPGHHPPSPTARPGGGVPPSSPSGQSPPTTVPLARAKLERGYEADDKRGSNSYRIELRDDDFAGLGGHEALTFDLWCKLNPARAAACMVIDWFDSNTPKRIGNWE
jgi:RNA polymerase sigma-70 factor (ECF subfamily)